MCVWHTEDADDNSCSVGSYETRQCLIGTAAKEAKKLGLEIISDRTALIESILNHLERTGPMDLATEAYGTSGGGSEQEGEGAAILTRKTVVGAVPKKKTAEEPLTVENFHRALSSVTSAMVRQQQECLAQQQRTFL